jgi:two-component system nitrogen regulation response regulator NtrX
MHRQLITKFTNISAPLLLRGETGTGKSYLAQKIYQNSYIHKEKFLTAHLASLKEELIESELFGFKKGSFTGATEAVNGYLKDTGSGTLFLDEVGELSLPAQKKLLYLLEEKRFTPIGSTHKLEFRGRIIMAKMVKDGSFREDLYYRIKVFQIELPDLKSSDELFFETMENLWKEIRQKYHKPHKTISSELKNYLSKLEWRGNFRELKNALEYALVMSEESQIAMENFPSDIHRLDLSVDSSPVSEESFLEHFPEDFNGSLEIFEKMYLLDKFKKNEGRVNETARKLGMSKTTLIQKARRYQINTLKIRAEASIERENLVA